MNADILLQYFDRISEAPDAIPRLRRFILDLAVRGKLVEQDPQDEPASKLLKRIQAEKARLVKEGLRKRDALPEIEENEVPFHVPTKWLWCRLGELGITQTGTTPPKAKPEHFGKHIPFVKPGDIYPDRIDYSNEGLSKIGMDESGRVAIAGSVLMVCIGTIGKCQRIDQDCTFNQQINSLSPYGEANSLYLLTACQSEFFQKAAWAASACTTIAILNKGKWELLPIPLPPLAEQQRIVAKVDELMALCDQLEAARNDREARRQRLTAASLQRLNQPADAASLRTDARFHLDNLTRLTTRPEQIKQLRQTILNLAVRGCLVPQDPQDEPASELLKRIQTEKAHLMLVRGIKRDKDVEYSFSIDEGITPKYWCWVHVADVALVQGGKRLPAGATFTKEKTSHHYIRVTDMKDKTIRTDDLPYITPEVQREIAKYTINKEDLYITIAGTIGQVGRVPGVLDGQNLTENAAKIVFREFDADFLVMALSSNAVQIQFQDKTKQMAQPKLALKRIAGARIPLPPLAEQHRIVARVEELMALCDQLETQLTTTATDSRRLLEAVLRDALHPAETRVD